MDILVLEDEKIAAQNIIRILSNYFEEEIFIQWVQSVEQGLKYLRNNEDPDLILSDIELLDGQVFSLYQQYEVQSPIIFTTAYDQFLLDAFQTNGIAYLLKPFTEEDLSSALDKYLKLFKSNKQTYLDSGMILQLKNALTDASKEFKTRFTIKKSNGIILVETKDIAYFLAQNELVYCIDNHNKKHVINYRMSDLEEVLNPSQFFRINRSEIVNINYIEKMEAYFGNRLSITLRGQKETLKTSGPKTAAFRRWLG